MTKTAENSFLHMPLPHKIGAGILVWQAIGPTKRIAKSTENKPASALDWGRALLGGIALYSVAEGFLNDFGGAEHIVSSAKKAITQKDQFSLGGREINLPVWAKIFALSGGAATIFGVLNHLEEERNETALKEAPLEAKAVRAAYDEKTNQRVQIIIHGKKTEVSGTQALARDYADKFLWETADGAKEHKTSVKKAMVNARNLITVAFNPEKPRPDLQEAIQLVSGDAFEAILLEKELPETAGVVTKRKRDEVMKFFRELPDKIQNIPFAGRFIRAFLPAPLERTIRQIAGAPTLKAGNLDLDPRSFIHAGNEKTRQQVEQVLRTEFATFIADEQSRDARGEHIALVNSVLPTGLKLSDSQKDAPMNTILAAVLVQEHPELAPKVAETAALLDAFQNKPESLSNEVLSKSPSYVRRTRG